MASRLLLLPGGLCNEHIDRIRSQPSWGSLWWPGDRCKHPYVCICEAGRDNRRWEAAGMKTMLEGLLNTTPDCQLIMNIVDLDWPNIAEHLARCDVFYMCGGEPQCFANLFRKYESTNL